MGKACAKNYRAMLGQSRGAHENPEGDSALLCTLIAIKTVLRPLHAGPRTLCAIKRQSSRPSTSSRCPRPKHARKLCPGSTRTLVA